jgi:hypothetical protein
LVGDVLGRLDKRLDLTGLYRFETISIRAESRPSPQLRSIGSPYEKADVRQHVAFSTAANGSKEPEE